MTRVCWGVVVCLTLGVTAPVSAQQTGSVGVRGGLCASGPGLAGTVNFLAEFDRWSLGAEVGAAGLGDEADAWHAGGAFVVVASVGRIRPHATLGVARYSWSRCAGCQVGLLGISLGAGASVARPESSLSLDTELRWHHQAQRLGGPEEMSFVTLMLGLALHW